MARTTLKYTVDSYTDEVREEVARFSFFDHAEKFARELLKSSETIERTEVLRGKCLESSFHRGFSVHSIYR